MNKLRNFKEIFRKDVTYDKSKSHKEPGFCALFRRHIFWKTEGGGGSNWPPAILGLILGTALRVYYSLWRHKYSRYKNDKKLWKQGKSSNKKRQNFKTPFEKGNSNCVW